MNIYRFIYKRIATAFDKQIDGRGLAAFRILWFINLFFEVNYVYRYRQLIFDYLPFVHTAEFPAGPVLMVWMVVIVFLVFGLFTRTMSIINYLFTFLIFGTAIHFEYHMYYLYTGINFLLLFIPVSRMWSLDRLLVKLKYSNTRFRYEPSQQVNSLSYLIPLLLGMAFIYFDSIFYKFGSWYWMRGLGMWLPSSLPFMTWLDTSWMLNHKWLMLGAGYLVVVFEFIFIFLFWFKKWRWPLVIIGLLLHIGILVEFPIPYFAIGVIALYLLLIPVGVWRKGNSKKAEPKLRFFYDVDCPLCTRTRIILEHFDLFKKVEFLPVQSEWKKFKALDRYSEEELLKDIFSIDKNGRVRKGYDTYVSAFYKMAYTAPLALLMSIPGLSFIGRRVYSFVAMNRATERCTEESCGYEPPKVPKSDNEFKILHNYTLRDLKIKFIAVGLILAVVLQFCVSLNSLIIKKSRARILGMPFNQEVTHFSSAVKEISRPLFGITNHPVFMDTHFKNYNSVISVRYRKEDGSEELLPFTTETGQPGAYLQNAVFVNWTFRTVTSSPDSIRLIEGLKRYTAFWAGKEGHSLDRLDFNIKVKRIDDYSGWEKEYLHHQFQHPWESLGTIQWRNGIFSAEFLPIINTL